ncbi:MAG: hypothetical protein HC784_10815 [Hydrococcus sp. CSU_1_8]|nr:hypothetical protein [Hydrococcus sp. CSU_1_8]
MSAKITHVRKWVVIGVGEILLSLFLIALAPVFLNSNRPIFGFLIWLFVPTLLGSSAGYVALKLTDARRARQIFIANFPEYSYLKSTDFLAVSSAQVTRYLSVLEAARKSSEFQQLDISLLALLQDLQNE